MARISGPPGGEGGTEKVTVTFTSVHNEEIIQSGADIPITATAVSDVPGETFSYSYVDVTDETTVSNTNQLPVGTNVIEAIAKDITPGSQYAGSSFSTEVTLNVACYGRGTRIQTEGGEVAIECLHAGDLVATERGEYRPIRWLGFRNIDCDGYRDPSRVWPIRIRKGAISEALPSRDLWVSPGHCLRIGDVLIQAEQLVNGVTITQEHISQIEYWHLELDQHDIVMAEGMPAESYLDTGNRTAFINGGDYLELHPDFMPKHWRETCLPLVTEGAELERAKAQTLARAHSMGHCITDDNDVHMVADGARIEKTQLREDRLAFFIPAGRQNIELRCRTFVPAWVNAASADPRELGVCVGRLQLDGTDIPLADDACFAEGWHGLEEFANGYRQRWSTKSVPIASGTQLLVIDVAGRSYCWADETAIESDAARVSA